MTDMKARIVTQRPPHWWPVFEPPFEVVGSLLYWDVGLTVNACELYIRDALEVAEGRKPASETCGNGHIVRLMPGWVLIANIYLEELKPVIISTDAYLGALRYWKSVLSDWDGVNPPRTPPDFVLLHPEPIPPLSSEDKQREIQTTLSRWTGFEPPHHISQVAPDD